VLSVCLVRRRDTLTSVGHDGRVAGWFAKSRMPSDTVQHKKQAEEMAVRGEKETEEKRSEVK